MTYEGKPEFGEDSNVRASRPIYWDISDGYLYYVSNPEKLSMGKMYNVGNYKTDDTKKKEIQTDYNKKQVWKLMQGVYLLVNCNSTSQTGCEFILMSPESKCRNRLLIRKNRDDRYVEALRKKQQNDAKPKIGMTGEEVKNTSWGSPNKINKYTYSWGTEEQWVYDNYRYVYFENGKVISISETN